MISEKKDNILKKLLTLRKLTVELSEEDAIDRELFGKEKEIISKDPEKFVKEAVKLLKSNRILMHR